jgi:hypothetical protein
MAYFFRSPASLIHYLKRQGFYIPRGRETPAMGMACFFDWDDRGRFNFAPDRSGVVLKVDKGHVSEVVMAVKKGKSAKSGYVVKQISVTPGDEVDRALIGYSDLP